MDLESFVSVSGIGGIHKVITTRNNGLIIEDLTSGKTRFISSRKHQFTPLESISVYTEDGDSKALSEVFQAIKDNGAKHPLPDAKFSNDDIKAYFNIILPDYDKDRVHASDMKKIIKWYAFLDEKNLLKESKKKDEDVKQDEPIKEKKAIEDKKEA